MTRRRNIKRCRISIFTSPQYFIRFVLSSFPLILFLLSNTATADDLLKEAKRVVFLGDSITYSGEYIAMLEAAIAVEFPEREIELLDLGLPSETVSGLSEPGHAGGNFPRPNLHERLDRVLQQTHPDLVIACYGMNCGIYHPYSDERFEAYRQGIRKLSQRVHAAKSRLVLLTPPVFDSTPILKRTLPAGEVEYRQPYRDYNQVLDLYSAWLVAAQGEGWQVLDIHTPMNRFLADQRLTDSSFTLADDGVHLNRQGHWLIARELIRTLGAARVDVDAKKVEDGFAAVGMIDPLLDRFKQRQGLLTDAWIGAIGHLRPGMKQGLPLDQANEQAQTLELEIRQLANSIAPFPGTKSDWHGFRRFDFDVNGKQATVVVPQRVSPGKPWVWHGEFFGHKPEPDIELLKRGFHIVYLQVPDLFGSPAAVSHWNDLYRELTDKYALAKRVGLVGLSRGGLYCYNWAIANPDKVACIYGDAPVCDFKSWPGGSGAGKRSEGDWARVLESYGFKSDAEAIAYSGNPVDNLGPLADQKIPLLHVFGDADDVVPWNENTGIVASRYQALGGEIQLIRKPGIGHHPHGLDDSTPIVDFLDSNCRGGADRRGRNYQ